MLPTDALRWTGNALFVLAFLLASADPVVTDWYPFGSHTYVGVGP